MNSPSINSSLARPRPTMRGNSHAAPMSAPDKPTLVNRNAILAVSAATRTSAAAAITAPAPHVVPLSAATIGFSSVRMFSIKSHVMRVNANSSASGTSNSLPMMSLTSPPEQNARPLPVISTLRTLSRVRNATNVSRSSAYESNVSALSRSGRSSVIVATPPSSE
jgi:hypothetical protein